jgi:hypothetical protein
MNTSNMEIIGNLMLRGVGMGMSMMPATTTSMNAVPRHLIPRATALTNALQRISGSFGTAVMSTILTTRQTYQFATASQTITPSNLGVQSILAHARTMPGLDHLSTPLLREVTFLAVYQNVNITAAVRAFDDTFFVASLICIPAVLMALTIRTGPKSAGPRPVLTE